MFEGLQNILQNIHTNIEEEKNKKMLENILLFSNVTGGTGTTTMVSTLAKEFKNKGLSVAVVDLNLISPNTITYFNNSTEEVKSNYDLISLLKQNCTIGESLTYIDDIAFLYANNRTIIDIINVDELQYGQHLEEALDQLSKLFDVVLIDTPNTLNNSVINYAFNKADKIYIVWNENANNIKAYDKFRRNLSLMGIYTRKSYLIFNARNDFYYQEEIFKTLDIKVMGILPYKKEIIEHGMSGKLVELPLSDEYSKALKQLVNTILAEGGFING